MREVAAATALLGALFIVVGLPSAVLLRRDRDGWVASLVDAAVHGLVWLPLAIVSWAWLGWWGLASVVVLWLVVAVAVVRRRAWPPVRGPGSLSGSDLALGVAWVGVLAVALYVRLREVNFLPWIGDMGAYVNWANEFLRTGELRASWPPLYPAYLSISTAMFGPDHTTIGMAAVGMVLLVVVARLLHLLGAPRWISLGAAGALALNVHAVWYSSFPTSESLNAPIFILWVCLVHRVLTSARWQRGSLVVAGGVVMLALGMLRGSGGLLLIPLMLMLVLVVVVRAWRGYAQRVWFVLAASGVAAVVSYWYGIQEIRSYFVEIQLASMIPGDAWQRARALGLFDATPGLFAVLVLLCLGVIVGSVLASRTGRALDDAVVHQGGGDVVGRPPGKGPAITLVTAGVALAAVLAWQWSTNGEMWQIVERMGPALAFGAVLAAAIGWRVRRQPDQLVVLLLVVTSVLFVALHAFRLGGARNHAFYLYWDRYLVSEVLPTFAVLSLLAAGWAATWVARRLTSHRGPARAWWRADGPALVAAAVSVTLIAVPTLPALRLAIGDVYMRGAYDLTTHIADLVPERDLPVYWSADGTGGVQDFFFPNTWMAFAVPLDRTFGHDVFNVNRGTTRDFGPDDVLQADAVTFAAACADVTDFVLLDIETGGQDADERLAGSGVELAHLGVAEGSVMFLTQPPGERGWHAVQFQVAAWRVTIPRDRVTPNPPCWVTGDGGSSGRSQLR